MLGSFLFVYVSFLLYAMMPRVKSFDYTLLTCPSGYVTLTQYSCGLDNVFMPQSDCPTGKGCDTSWVCALDVADDEVKCPSLITCPDDRPIRCPDGLCAENPDGCNNYVSCPPSLPVRCPTGACRQNIQDCPSTIYCNPPNVLCNDGTCKSTANDCDKVATDLVCVAKSLVRCNDGSCQSSSLLCPTSVTCPKDRLLQYNGICAKKNDKDSTNKLCEKGEVLCNFDYSCRDEIKNCPTGIICPADKPVKCWDQSCKETLESCPAYQDCPTGMKACPDGSCVSTTKDCGAHITCSNDAPYRCFDNTCRQNPDDCKKAPNCPSEAPILCWDGRCLSDRSECLAPDTCLQNAPVRCPNGICYNSVDDCSIKVGCPNGYTMCPDGTCRLKKADCEEQKCGISYPYKCKNGLCVTSAEYCEHDNGCPFNKMYKCMDGYCTANLKECEEHLLTNPNSTMRICPDGSILAKVNNCPEPNGCTSDAPLKCANGECIDPKKATCPVPNCPESIPFRCVDGRCVEKSAYCVEVNSTRNSEGFLTCADGTEAANFEECKPLLPCEEPKFRCGDGSCKDTEDQCPRVLAKDACPPGRPIRCRTGDCAVSEEKCPNSKGCLSDTQLRQTTGLCYQNSHQLADYNDAFDNDNGCPTETKIRCLSGKCVRTQASCGDGNGCNDPKLPVKCQNGECAATLRECRGKGTDCPNPCPYTKAFSCGTTFESCFNDFNCTIDMPFRCVNGQCRRYPMQLGLNETYDDLACPIGVKCPDYKPFLCADGSCVSRKDFCTSHQICSGNTPKVCFDRTCVTETNQCTEKCPAKNPILCPNSNCVSSLLDCTENSCPVWKPWKCYSGPCKDAPYECLEKTNFQDIHSLCGENEVTCYDGSCRASQEDCPLYQGCNLLSLPFKCPTGTCAKNSKSCVKTYLDMQFDECMEEEEEGKSDTPKNCWHYKMCTPPPGAPESNTTEEFCNDGLCHALGTCPEYNGCPFEKSLLCSTGNCVANEEECAGESNCASIETPFKCIDGSCKKTMKECSSPLKGFGATDIKLSSFKNYDVTADIVLGENNMAIASVYIPTSALRHKYEEKDVEGQIIFKSVSQSSLRGTFSHYDKTRQEDVEKFYPYGDPKSSYTLEYEYGVVSAVVKIRMAQKNTTFKSSILLTLMYDFPEVQGNRTELSEEANMLFMDLNGLQDVCLARLVGKEWVCVSEIPEIKKTDRYRLQSAITEEGTYAVILNPIENATKLKVANYFIIRYRVPIAIITLISVVIIGLAVYIFYRQYRYRSKYKEMANSARDFEKELEEMGNASASVLGQTIGDTKEGVVFTDNVSFKKQKDEALNKRIRELERLHEKTKRNLSTCEQNNKLLVQRLEEMRKNYAEYKLLKEQGNTQFAYIDPNAPMGGDAANPPPQEAQPMAENQGGQEMGNDLSINAA